MGFQLTCDGMRPSQEMLQSIRNFPRPVNIKGVYWFFGLVEQVSWAFSKTKDMAPFRKLLSPMQELNDAFEKAKLNIVRR